MNGHVDTEMQIADFGFAATNRPAMMCQSIVGTKTYMAPELLGRMGAYRNSDHGYDATLVRFKELK